MTVPAEGKRQVPSSAEIPKRKTQSSRQNLNEWSETGTNSPDGFWRLQKFQLILCFYIKPKKLQQGLLHGHCQDWAKVRHSFPSTWENKRTRHLASYTASWGLEQSRRGIGKALGIGEWQAPNMVFPVITQPSRKKTLGTLNLIHFVLSRGKCSPTQEASGGFLPEEIEEEPAVGGELPLHLCLK